MRNIIFKLLFFILPLLAFTSEAVVAEPIPADIRYLHVQKGQTLHNIVSKLYDVSGAGSGHTVKGV